MHSRVTVRLASTCLVLGALLVPAPGLGQAASPQPEQPPQPAGEPERPPQRPPQLQRPRQPEPLDACAEQEPRLTAPLAGLRLRELPPAASGTTAERFLNVRAQRQRFLVLLEPGADRNGPPRCTVFPVTQAPQLHGRFSAERGQLWARVLAPSGCNDERCRHVVALLDGLGNVIAATRMAQSCDAGASVQSLSLFPGAESLRLDCRQGRGAAERVSAELWHLVDHQLLRLHRLELGVREFPTDEERATPGFCPRQPVGQLWVRDVGERPRLETLEPAPPLPDGAGQATRTLWRYQPAQRRFEPVEAPRREASDARAGCRRAEVKP